MKAAADLTGKVAVITGAANILGPEFAAALAEHGASVVLADIAAESCARHARQVSERYGVRTHAAPIDVSDEDAVRQMLERAAADFGSIDILVNAAATKTPGYFRATEDYDLADWNRVMAVNLTGMFLCIKHALPHFARQGHGTVVNVASLYGVVGPDPRIYEGSWYLDQQINTPAIYAASKGGVVSLTRYFATVLAPRGIRVNCLSPGGVFSGQNDTFVASYSQRAPLGRMARREELRGPLVFLASDASSYVTGHNLVVDGGWTAW